MKKITVIIALCLLAWAAKAVNVTLLWDTTPTALSYRLYQSVGAAPFAPTLSVSGTTIQVSGVSTTAVTRWFVTGVNTGGEGPPSTQVSYDPTVPPLPTGTLGLSVPTLTTTNVLRGQTITGTARFTNGTIVPVTVTEGWITARQPGASNQSGPFDDWSPGMPAQTVAPGGVVTLTASWVVRPDAPFGVWQAHLAVKVDGTFHDGGNAPFNVLAPTTTPPPAPTNLRIITTSRNSIKMQWDVSVISTSEVERSKEEGSFVRIATLSPGVEEYEDKNLQRRRDWRYRVRQVSGAFGVTPYSNILAYSSR